jgi:hypothetical protein
MATEPVSVYMDAADALKSGAILAQCSGPLCSVFVDGTAYDVVGSVRRTPENNTLEPDRVTLWLSCRPIHESTRLLRQPRHLHWDVRFGFSPHEGSDKRAQTECAVTAQGRNLKFTCGRHRVVLDVCGLPRKLVGVRCRNAVKLFLYRSKIADALAAQTHQTMLEERKVLSAAFLNAFESAVLERPRCRGKSTLVQDLVALHQKHIVEYT